MFFLQDIFEAELQNDTPLEIPGHGPSTSKDVDQTAGDKMDYGQITLDDIYDLLITFVRDDHPYIFDKSHPLYMERGSQERAFLKISAALSTLTEKPISGKEFVLTHFSIFFFHFKNIYSPF